MMPVGQSNIPGGGEQKCFEVEVSDGIPAAVELPNVRQIHPESPEYRSGGQIVILQAGRNVTSKKQREPHDAPFVLPATLVAGMEEVVGTGVFLTA